MIDPVTLLAAARTVVQLAHAAGLVRSSADRELERVAKDVRSLVEAPLHEGLDRVVMAAQVQDVVRQEHLLSEARSRLHDAAARVEMPKRNTALACATSAALARHAGQTDEAKVWMLRALKAYDAWMVDAHRGLSAAAAHDALNGRWAKAARGPGAGGAGAMTGAAAVGFAAAAAPAVLAAAPVFLGARAALKAYQSHQMRDLPWPETVTEVNGEVTAALAMALGLGVEVRGHCRELSVERVGRRSWKFDLVRV